MRLYSCKVRLKSSLYHEVEKLNVTAPEIMVLQHIQRPEGMEKSGPGVVDPSTVVSIKYLGDVTRSDMDERVRLHDLYGPALRKMELSLVSLFGAPGVPLPNTVEGAEGEQVAFPVVEKRGPGRPKKVEDAEAVVAA